MPYETVYVGAVLLSGVSALAIAILLWVRNLGLASRVFAAFLALHPVAAVLVAAELLAPPGSDLAITLYGLHNAAVVPVVPLWFAFAVLYTDRRHWLSRPVLAIIGGWTLLALFVEATNPIHGLVWSGYQVVETPFPYTVGVPRPYFGVFSLPQPLLNLVAMALLGHRFLFGSGVTRSQSLALFVGFLPPWLVFGAWGAGMLPGPLNGWFVIGSSWSLALVAWAIFRYQLFDVVPLARETVFEDLEDAVVVVDDDLRLLDFNRAAATTFPTLVGGRRRPLADLVPPLVTDDGEGGFATSFSSDVDGEARSVDVSYSELTAGGEVRGHALVLRDVTERRARQRELQETSRRLETVLDTMEAAVFMKDTDGQYLLRNRWARDLLPADGTQGGDDVTDFDIFPDDLASQILTYDREVIETGETLEVEVEIPTVSGPRVLHAISSPILDGGDDVHGVCVVATDVTEDRERERRLEGLNEQLMVLNRITRHDIRNDMNVVVGWATELEPHVDQEGRSILERILSTSKHVVDLTLTVRDFAEALGTDSRPTLEPIDLGAHLRQELEKRRALYPDALFSIEDEISSVTVEANELLSSVFRNILNNAVQHNDKDEPRVNVRVHADDQVVTVRIADNGPGIPDDRKDAVFGRGESGLDHPAAGLGLYLVDTLVDSYGGTVRIEDNDPEGCVFVVELLRTSESSVEPSAVTNGRRVDG